MIGLGWLPNDGRALEIQSGAMRPKGQLQWKVGKTQWPHGPVQWVVTVVGGIETVAFIVVLTRVHGFSDMLMLNLVFFGSLVLLDLLYRWVGRRRRA